MECMSNQKGRIEDEGTSLDFWQRQCDLSASPVMHFTNAELESIYNKTSKDVSEIISNEADIDFLEQKTMSGVPKALYVLANRDGGLARLCYNGERKKLLMERGVLLLIAAIKGEYERAKESLDYAAKALLKYPIAYEELNSFEKIKAKVEELWDQL